MIGEGVSYLADYLMCNESFPTLATSTEFTKKGVKGAESLASGDG